MLVARTGTLTCLVAMLERYFAMAKLSGASKLHLFRSIVITKDGEKLHSKGSLSYTRLSELFLAVVWVGF